MKLHRAMVLAGAGAIMVRGGAQAAYTGLSLQSHSILIINGKVRSVWRVYANFTNPEDLVFSWGGSRTNPFLIESRNASDTGPGSNFFNPGGVNGNTAPTLEQINGGDKTPAIPNIQWGTFATIGVTIAEQGSGPTPEFPNIDQTSLTLGFPNFILGNVLNADDSVFAVPQSGPDSQGKAGYLDDGDPLLRVLLMQLTVNFNDTVRGELNLGVQLGGTGQTITFQDQTFNYPGSVEFCIGDVVPPHNNVNVDDLLAVISAWGMCPPPPESCPADVYWGGGNGVVNVDDLLIVIADWGPCIP